MVQRAQTVPGFGGFRDVQVQFVPETIGTYPGAVTFTCTGAPLPCDVVSTSRTITETRPE